MRKTESNFLRFAGMIFFVLVFTFNLHSWVLCNGTPWGFNEEYQEQLEDEILAGAGNFLDSYSEILKLFQRIELAKLAPLEFDKLRIYVDNAVLKMENARDAYMRLNEKSTKASYDLKIINRLFIFDFANFKNQRGLNAERLSEVSTFLSKGDVRGVYHRVLTDVEQLLHILYRVKNTIDSGRVPEVRILWNLNQLYSRTIMFGQYVANVFYKITGK